MPLPTELHYRVTDPCAVRISLGPTDGPRVPWVFARDLLSEGLHRPTGAGDVLVLPPHGHHPDTIRVILKNGAGPALPWWSWQRRKWRNSSAGPTPWCLPAQRAITWISTASSRPSWAEAPGRNSLPAIRIHRRKGPSIASEEHSPSNAVRNLHRRRCDRRPDDRTRAERARADQGDARHRAEGRGGRSGRLRDR
ncbi:SsgA family sporulation/cell division regulator [Streptomyces sp. NPDC050400]|uniref:SsgA family sporulation/cell division regulator n=1 Tax=Streptomyces sp. NPDC050400 TaxID=3365610 RepID=UPI0037A90C36